MNGQKEDIRGDGDPMLTFEQRLERVLHPKTRLEIVIGDIINKIRNAPKRTVEKMLERIDFADHEAGHLIIFLLGSKKVLKVEVPNKPKKIMRGL